MNTSNPFAPELSMSAWRFTGTAKMTTYGTVPDSSVGTGDTGNTSSTSTRSKIRFVVEVVLVLGTSQSEITSPEVSCPLKVIAAVAGMEMDVVFMINVGSVDGISCVERTTFPPGSGFWV